MEDVGKVEVTSGGEVEGSKKGKDGAGVRHSVRLVLYEGIEKGGREALLRGTAHLSMLVKVGGWGVNGLGWALLWGRTLVCYLYYIIVATAKIRIF